MDNIMTSPYVSVVMPVYNGEKYLHEAVESILKQTYSDFEFIIVDDGSTDSTPQLLQSIHDPRVKILGLPTNRGFTTALRTGINYAQGEWIARMDSDDISHSNRLDFQIGFLAAHPDCVFVGTAYHYISPAGKFISKPISSEGWHYLTKEMLTFSKQIFADPSVVFHRKTALQVGLYDDDLPFEIPLWYKLLQVGKGAETFKPFYCYRITTTSLSKKKQRPQSRQISYQTRVRYDPDNANKHPSRDPKLWQTPDESRIVNYLQSIRLCNVTSDKKYSTRLALEGLKEYPLEIRLWKALFKSITGVKSLRFWRKVDENTHSHEIIDREL
jgi:glycosyltransferase involved in cell wall biosynthesis